MAANGSMAVWCVHRAGSQNATAEVHFNYWRIAGDTDFSGRRGHPARDFAEIGIWLATPLLTEKVYIFIPEVLDDNTIEDCGPYFSEVSIAQGIFNEPLSCISAGPPGPPRVELQKGQAPYCRVHKFMKDSSGKIDLSQLSRTDYPGGTLLEITRCAIDEVCTTILAAAYFRLRIYVKDRRKGPFVRVIPPKDRFFQSGFDEVEYVDFRLNEARTLPPSIETRMRTDHAVSLAITKVAFLTAVPVLSDLTASNRESHKNRLLEHDLWDPYIPSGIPPGMMVYHWRKDEAQGVEDFSAFVKLQTRRSGRRTLYAYLAVAFVFGIVGNLVASEIQPHIEHVWIDYVWNRIWSMNLPVSPSKPTHSLPEPR
ncbi:hypothetical protein [Beijerinckia indica]|uniref:Uncharacterized protein n=1 Tax=Beijerinckia indica subsp. indica (strain ATCC 9039 / DSM 1715 / NCIMB 8712) TaxID=395963 RepID=B2IF56_BEII9|nr:hypothetical protein [Beijerinckia indica]ACB95621.1 conserved hypothetical protein [Beijerinckia indica subsp. indica ATCC 9039]